MQQSEKLIALIPQAEALEDKLGDGFRAMPTYTEKRGFHFTVFVDDPTQQHRVPEITEDRIPIRKLLVGGDGGGTTPLPQHQ